MKQSSVLFLCLLALIGWFGFVGFRTVQGQGRLTSSMTLHWSKFNRPNAWFRLSGVPPSSIDTHGRLEVQPTDQVVLTVAIPPRWRTLTFQSPTGILMTPLDRRTSDTALSGTIDLHDLLPVAGAYRFVLTNTTSQTQTVSSLSVRLHL